ncbi:hypothetical protein Y1Q_0019823 [Alligator mississippiensis]|uniref:Uncharacterized protein n=1 Tax=Alligator mississippiensis TaxID=8496 RepID=A0A151PF62_ALLMI|nr:hypothetical protein Y1Q_0019823 [Alligator mississippiensis]
MYVFVESCCFEAFGSCLTPHYSGTLVLQQRWSQTGHRWTPLPGIVAQTEVPGCQEASLHRQRLRHDLSKYGRWPSMHFEDENSLIACAQNEVEHL